MNEPADTTLDVGILVDSEFVEQWQRDALDRLVRELDAEITTVVVNDQEFPSNRWVWESLAQRCGAVLGKRDRMAGLPGPARPGAGGVGT